MERKKYPIRCGAKDRSDLTDMRTVVCLLPPGHDGMHDDRHGYQWTDDGTLQRAEVRP